MILSLSLLKNSDDYLIESLKKAISADKEPKDWKYALLNIVQSIELAMKERLRMEHQCLIYENIDKPNNTISLEKALDRLVTIAKIVITKDDMVHIKMAKDWRNALTHFEFQYDVDAVKVTYTKLFGFLNSFNERHLNRQLKDALTSKIWQQITSYYIYTKELGDRAKDLIRENNYKEIIYCNECGEETFIVDNGLNTCLTCKHKDIVLQCYECENLIYKDEAKMPYLGIITGGNQPDKIGTEFRPILCEKCYEEYKKEYDL